MIFYEDILRTFKENKVKYILAGGIAVNLHGYLRSTGDLDILVEMTESNLKKIVAILKKHGYRVKQPVDPMLIADNNIRKEWITKKHLKAFNFYKESELKEVDILLKTPVNYEKAKKHVLYIRADDGLTVPVVSLNDLIKMKKNTGRDKDKIDIMNLKAIDKAKKIRDREI